MKTLLHKISNCRGLVAAVIVQAAVLAAAVPAGANANITWSPAGNITGVSDMSTTGTLVYAYNIGEDGEGSSGVQATTVNGVSFQPFAVPTGNSTASNGPVSLATPSIFLSDNTIYGSASSPFSSLPSSYQTLLQSATIVAQPDNFVLTLGGLTAGKTYQFEAWMNFSGPVNGLHSLTAGNQVVLNDNTNGLEGGLGQFAIGTFVADATTEAITFAPVPTGGPSSFAQLNGFQLRTGGVPDTGSTFALLGVALLGLIAFSRKTARQQTAEVAKV